MATTLTSIGRILNRILDELRRDKPAATLVALGGGSPAPSPIIEFDPLITFANSQSIAVVFGGAAVSTSLLAARAGRKYLRVSIVGAVVTNFAVDEPAVVNAGVKVVTAINNPALWEPYPVPTGEIFGINAVAGGIASIIEGF